MTIVRIARGFHRGQIISGDFVMIRPYKDGAGGGFITVEAPKDCTWSTTFCPRIKLNKTDYTILSSDEQPLTADTNLSIENTCSSFINYESQFIASESENDAMIRIEDSFLMLDKMTDACSRGIVRGLIVSGPPGVGKSFGVERKLEEANLFNKIGAREQNYEIVSGAVSGICLYQKLYHSRKPENVLVFDDCDGILFEEESLLLLKAALNSGERRRICWNKESRVLLSEGIPDTFDFDASIIFLSNVDFEKSIARKSRISSHLEAMLSRCHYLDLEIGSTRDKLLRIKQVIRDGMLKTYDLEDGQEPMIVDFVFSNYEHMKEISLRAVKKIADLIKADPVGWENMAEMTILSREAKFKRLLAKRQKAEQHGLVLTLD